MRIELHYVECIYKDAFEPTGEGYWDDIILYIPDLDQYICPIEGVLTGPFKDDPFHMYNITNLSNSRMRSLELVQLLCQ